MIYEPWDSFLRMNARFAPILLKKSLLLLKVWAPSLTKRPPYFLGVSALPHSLPLRLPSSPHLPPCRALPYVRRPGALLPSGRLRPLHPRRARTRSLPPARQSAPSAARSRSARRGLHGSRRRKRGIAPSSQCSHANALQSRISSCASGRDFLPRFLLELPCCLKWRGCSPCTRGAAMWPYWLLPQSRIDFHPSAVLAEKRSSRGRFRMQRTNVSAWLVAKCRRRRCSQPYRSPCRLRRSPRPRRSSSGLSPS